MRGDYKALKKDLLEAFGELTTDPKLVLRFLLEVCFSSFLLHFFGFSLLPSLVGMECVPNLLLRP